MPAISIPLAVGGAGLGVSGIGLANAPEGFEAPWTPSGRILIGKPGFFQYLQMGGDLDAVRVKRAKGNKGWVLPDGTTIKGAQTHMFGGKRYALPFGEAKAIFDQQAQAFQAQQRDTVKKELESNFNSLFGEDGPAFLKDIIGDTGEARRERFAPRFQQLLQEAIGSAAPRGTLTTDAALNQFAGPTGLAAEQFFAATQDRENAMKLGLAGVPGYGAGLTAGSSMYTSPMSQQSIQNSILQAAQLGLQAQLPALQSQFQADGAQFGATMGLGSSLLNLAGALGGGFGGSPTGGGGGYPSDNPSPTSGNLDPYSD